MPRVDSLTGLRWWAAFFVFLFHMRGLAPLPEPVASFVSYGFFGVNFFFVLSGFVLTWSASSRVSQTTFYWRRFARIYPTHLVALLIAIPVFYSFTPDPAQSWVQPVSVGILLLSVVLLQGWSNDPAILFSGNPAAWTLTCEAFFYALHPFISRVLNRVRVRGALIFALATVLLAFAYRAIASGVPDLWALPLPVVYLTQFAAGMGVAWAIRCGWRPRIPIVVGLAAPAVTLIALVLAPRYAAGWLITGVLQTYANEIVTVACVITIAAFAGRNLEGRPSTFAGRTMVRLGEWSYAFYLIHATLMYIALALFGSRPASWGNIGWQLAMLAISIAAAAVLHLFVEKPFERWIRAWRDRREAAADVRAAARG